MGFITRPDYSNNRQIKQFELTSTQLSGTTVFGVDNAFISENLIDSTININALQNIQTKGLIFPETIPVFTGATYQLLGRDNSNGKLVEIVSLSGGTPSTTIKQVQIMLNSSEIENLGTTPILAVSGVSLHSLTVVDAVAEWNWGSVAFDENSIGIRVVGGTNNLATFTSITGAVAQDIYLANKGYGTGTGRVIKGAGLELVGVDSTVTGNSSCWITITYVEQEHYAI
jgi:hypothetical protein